jgi:hypothetical protein
MKTAAFRQFLVLGMVVIAAGCSSNREQTAAEGESERAKLDRLRSLPYVAFSADAADGERSGVTLHDPERYSPGYNLHINQFLCSAEVTDRDGNVVNSWSHAPCHHWENGRLLPNGDFVVTAMGVIDKGKFREQHVERRYLLRMSWNGEIVWKKPFQVHHDVVETPDGDLMTLTMGYRRVPSFHAGLDVRDNLVVIVSQEGDLIEEVSLFDVFYAASHDFQMEKSGMKIKRKMREFDLLHVNSVEWMDDPALAAKDPIYGLDNVLITSRNQDVMAIINWKTKELVWNWGRGEMLGPHDATVLEDGRILVFDNGLGRGWSRALEVDPLTGEIVWEYKAPNPEEFYTRSRGGNQRLANGNTLLTNSNNGQAIEVTRDGEIVWEYSNPHLDEKGHRATIFRMERYEPDFIEAIRRQTGKPAGERS